MTNVVSREGEVIGDNNWLPTEDELDKYLTTPEKINERLSKVEQQQSYIVHKEELRIILREKRKAKKELKPTTGFVKVHKKIFMKAVRDRLFTPAEERMLFKITPFCNVETNVITDEEGFPMTQKDIIKLVGMNKNDVIATLQGLIDKGVLAKQMKGKSAYYKFTAEWIGNNP